MEQRHETTLTSDQAELTIIRRTEDYAVRIRLNDRDVDFELNAQDRQALIAALGATDARAARMES